MQILHIFAGSVAEYRAQLDNPDQYRPDHCPQCPSKRAAEGARLLHPHVSIRTVSLLPEFALPYLRSSVTVIALFLMARLRHGRDSRRSAPAGVALPARVVVGPPFSWSGRFVVRRVVRAH